MLTASVAYAAGPGSLPLRPALWLASAAATLPLLAALLRLTSG